MRPKLRQFEYLIALSETGNFHDAAELCHVTQPTLSAGIVELESIIQKQLVKRGKKKTTLTAFGQKTVDQARQILFLTDQIVQAGKPTDSLMAEPIRMGVIPTIAPYFLPDILPKVQAEYPDLELQIFEEVSARLLEDLVKGTIDLAFMAFPYDTPGMEQVELFDEPFVFACHQGVACPDKIAVKNLKNHNLLLLEEGHCLREHALEACRLQPPSDARRTFSATSLQTIVQMVANGHGATLLPLKMAKYGGLPEGVKLAMFKDPQPMRKLGLVWRQGSPRAKAYKGLAKVIIESVGSG